jgi:hypothetical protein
MAREALAAEVRLGETVALEHRPHRPVEDEDALRKEPAELFGRVLHGSAV